jgi:hypothetical protein
MDRSARNARDLAGELTGGVPAVSSVDPVYYAYWLVGLAVVGVVLLLASHPFAVHLLVTAIEVLVTWALAIGFSLLPI